MIPTIMYEIKANKLKRSRESTGARSSHSIIFYWLFGGKYVLALRRFSAREGGVRKPENTPDCRHPEQTSHKENHPTLLFPSPPTRTLSRKLPTIPPFFVAIGSHRPSLHVFDWAQGRQAVSYGLLP